MGESFESTLNFLPSTAPGNASAFPEGCKIEEIWRFLRSNRVNRVSSELCWSSGERSQPGRHLMKLPASSSFGRIEIHRPPGFETRPELQQTHCP